MRALTTLLVLAPALLAAGCRTVRSEPREVPAVIVEPTPASRAALAAAVSAALHGAPVTLADDALTRSSALSVERAPLRDPCGLPVSGRELGMPERFRLVMRGDACLLVHEGTGQAVTLDSTRCVPSGD